MFRYVGLLQGKRKASTKWLFSGRPMIIFFSNRFSNNIHFDVSAYRCTQGEDICYLLYYPLLINLDPAFIPI